MTTTKGNGPETPHIIEPPPDHSAERAPDLGAESIDEFLEWAGGVPTGGAAVVRERIAEARDDSTLLGRLLEELWKLPVRDDTRHFLLLWTIGELRDGRATEELARYVWIEDERISGLEHEMADGCGFEPSTAEVLKARAVEMLAYLGTSESDEEALRVAADHPTASVRAAAIDAHLYNHDDTSEEMDRLRGRLRSSDAHRVGLPRFTREGDPERSTVQSRISTPAIQIAGHGSSGRPPAPPSLGTRADHVREQQEPRRDRCARRHRCARHQLRPAERVGAQSLQPDGLLVEPVGGV